jgi:flagellar biogenesis protein FliO
MDIMDSVVKMVSSLAVVLALVLLTAAAARRWLGARPAGRTPMQSIRIAGSLTLGGRRSVLVLEIAGRTLVVGATPQQLVLLTQFENAGSDAPQDVLVESEFVRPAPGTLAGTWKGRFADALQECRQRFYARSNQ